MEAFIALVFVLGLIVGGLIVHRAATKIFIEDKTEYYSSNPNSNDNSGLQVVISKDFDGNDFLNLLMPDGNELPFVRKCVIKSDTSSGRKAIAKVELVANISTIPHYFPKPKKWKSDGHSLVLAANMKVFLGELDLYSAKIKNLIKGYEVQECDLNGVTVTFFWNRHDPETAD